MRNEPLILQGGENKTVNRIPVPFPVGHLGWVSPFQRLERPPLAAPFQQFRPGNRVIQVQLGRFSQTRIGSPHSHPFFEIRDYRVLQFWSIVRHFEPILVADGPNHNALLRLSRYDHRALVASRQKGVAVIQGQSGLAFVHAVMALVTTLRQDRPDLAFKKLHLPGWHSKNRPTGTCSQNEINPEIHGKAWKA